MARIANSPRSGLHNLAGRALARRWLDRGLDLVFPPACALCLAPLEMSAEGLLCPGCRDELVDCRPACPRCGSSGLIPDPAGGCPRCNDQRLHFDAVVRLGTYDGPLRTAVLRTKRPAERGLAIALGELLVATRAGDCQSVRPEAIVPVPMHWSRRMWRGVNSPHTIAERLARHLGLPLAAHLLVRRRRTAPQASLSAARRVTNVRGAFRAGRHGDLAGARLLVVDDVMTTGATVNEAAKTLRQAGAASISVVVLARSPGLGSQ